ncbi:MAG: hypothetical protein HOI19_18580 [Rhodospirillaceae bacterium]|nr:hypothetical protein [Rhodospirillaceae bacterium]
MLNQRAGLFAVGIAMATPGLAALGAFAAFGYLDPALAAGAGVAVLAASLIVCRQPVRDRDRALEILESVEKPTGVSAPKAGELERAALTATGALRNLQTRHDTLLAAAQHTENLIERLPAPLIVTDAGRNVTLANRAARRLSESGPKPDSEFNASPTSMKGRDLATAIRHPVLLDGVDRARTTGDGATVDITLPVPVERTYAVHIEPFETGADEAAIVLYFQERTAIERGAQTHRDFIANVSHELRTPLTSLAGFIETLRGTARDDPKAAETFLPIMQAQTDRMTRLISGLLSLSRIELEEHTRPSDAMALGPLLRSIRDTLQLKAMERGIRLLIDVEDDAPPVLGERDQLIQVFQNLFDNAVKYGGEGGAVTASATFDDDSASISVTDEGDGVPPEAIPRLTERFYRVDPARSRELGGAGLGLAIVKHIVNRHRGKLSIQSAPGQGSTFTVTLPLANFSNPDN